MDPHVLEPEEWAARFTEAAWLENKRLENFAKVIGQMFAGEER
jgi:hypothetical protein